MNKLISGGAWPDDECTGAWPSSDMADDVEQRVKRLSAIRAPNSQGLVAVVVVIRWNLGKVLEIKPGVRYKGPYRGGWGWHGDGGGC